MGFFLYLFLRVSDQSRLLFFSPDFRLSPPSNDFRSRRLLLVSDGASTFRAVFLPVATGCKGLSTPFVGPCTLPVNIGAEYLVGGQNRTSEVLAQQRIGNRLHAHAAFAIVQRQDSCHRHSWRTAAGSASCSVPFGRVSGV